MATLWRDFCFAFRLLGKNKGFTAIAILALALGIGPNTAIFSVIYATMFAPMPYHNPDQLVMVWSKIQGHRNGIAAGDYLDWVRDSKSFQGLWAWSGFSANLSGTQEPENINGTSVRPGMLSGWGARMLLGRDFLPEEAQVGRDREVILMHKLWVRRFGSRPDIIGQQIRLNGENYTVVGVLMPGQQDRMPNELYAPLAFKPDQINHDFHWMLCMGRLKDGVTIAQAQADMDAVTKHIGEVYPQDKGWGASVEPLRNDFLPRERISSLWLMMASVGFVLLIACANVANLLLARGTSRQREVAVRASLGASRGRLFSQLLTESLALALAGGLVGVGLGWGILKAVTAFMPDQTLPSEADVTLNVPVLLFTFCAAVLAGVLAGCAPAWQAARLDLNETLKQTGRAVSAGRHWLRRVLVVAEFALALTLLAGAGLAIHSFWKITQLDLGVRTDHLLTFYLPVPRGQLTDPDQLRNFYRQMLAQMEALPGVQNAAVTTGMPLQGTGFGMFFNIAGQTFANPSDRPGCGFQMITPGYFKTFGVHMVRGRPIDEHDIAGSVRVAVIDENFVKRYFKNSDPIGQRLEVEELTPGVQRTGHKLAWEIVGVFHTVQYGDRPSDDFPVMYVPFWQSPWPGAQVAVRTGGDPESMKKSLAVVVHSLDPELPMAGVETMDQIVSETRAGDRFGTVLYGSFAAVALLLAALGIYGVIAFLVEQRTHEIGLRIALGAGRREVFRLVVGEGMMLAACGLGLGLVGAYLVGRMMQSMLYGVGAFDFGAVGAVGAVLLGSALLACYVPARRAAGVDPMIALRAE
ncbi:MAG TPA: ABC transporter permease [Bryobacteraceae bacterium]|nr:ABC transporter permease [Bryobacteraceae bacterium]